VLLDASRRGKPAIGLWQSDLNVDWLWDLMDAYSVELV